MRKLFKTLSSILIFLCIQLTGHCTQAISHEIPINLTDKTSKGRCVCEIGNSCKLAWKYKDANSVSKSKVNDYISYRSIYKNADLKYTLLANEILESFTLKSGFNKETIVVDYNMNGSCIYKPGNGNVHIKSNDNTEEFILFPYFLIDSKGKRCNEVYTSIISEDKNHISVQIKPNSDWLNDKERKFPITLSRAIVKVIDDYMWPVPAYHYISSDFYDVVDRNGKIHGADDIAGVGINGAFVAGCEDGIVIKVNTEGYGGGFGKYVMVSLKDGNLAIYAHLSDVCVKEKEKIKKGDKIGEVGSTGNSTGYHLHIEIRKGSVKVDPMILMGLICPEDENLKITAE